MTTITNPENGDKKTFTFDHSYWSHDSYKEDSDGVSIADGSIPYADQVGTFKCSNSNACIVYCLIYCSLLSYLLSYFYQLHNTKSCNVIL